MSIKHALLSLLHEQPCGVGQLRQRFEHCTNGTWPVNVGQVYQTIQRLHRDGLVEHIGTESGTAGRNAEIYQITELGKDTLLQWWRTPTVKPREDRDELVIKIAMGVLAAADVRTMIQRQRVAAMEELREINRLKAKTLPEQTADRLLLERRIFDLEAEARWLDHIETLAPPKESTR